MIFDKFFRRQKRNPLNNDKRILAIDDDQGQRTLIEKTLTKRGYTVLLAESGEEGIKLAKSENPDLILLDVIMPGIPGNDVCRRLKADSQTKDIPVIFLTSVNTPRGIIEHYDLGAEIHLTKPIRPKELISQVEITLEGDHSD